MKRDAVTRAGLSADTAIFPGFAPPPFDSLVNKLALLGSDSVHKAVAMLTKPGKIA